MKSTDLIESTISKLTLKQIGSHLLSYVNLYVSPFSSWKKVLTARSTSVDFVILHLIYYSFFILVIAKDIYLAIPLVFIEVIITGIPFIIIYPSFKLCNKLAKITIKDNRLFRLCLIFKFQTAPVLILSFFLADSLKSEDFYILTDNLIWAIWIGCLIVYPISSRLSPILKSVAVFASYLSFLTFLLFISILFSYLDIDKGLTKLNNLSPSKELNIFKLNSSNASLYIDETKYLLIGHAIDSVKVLFTNTQYASLDLCIAYHKSVHNQSAQRIKYYDSLLTIMDSTYISKKDSTILYSSNELLSKHKLDSSQQAINKIIDIDISLTDTLMKNAQFPSNRAYFKAYNDFLKEYYNTYTISNLITETLKKGTKGELLELDNGEFIIMYSLDSTVYLEKKNAYLDLELKLSKRDEYSKLISNVFLYPIEFIFELFYEE